MTGGVDLELVNADGEAALREYLGSGAAVAFLGAGASVPLYPLWGELIRELVDRAAAELDAREAATCRERAAVDPDAVVEVVRQRLGDAQYRGVLREVFRIRRDPETGRSWTATQELIARCAFKGVITTNFDPGIVDARMRVRPQASGTGFATWADDDLLDRWRTGEVFGDDELPVLYAHGQHNRPEDIVLATADYRRAYGGKLPHVLSRFIDAGHVIWVGFGFTDQRIGAIVREVAELSGTRAEPGSAPRHVAVLPWDPSSGDDPGVLRMLAEIQYGARVVLYPVRDRDHSALHALLEKFAGSRYPAVSRPAKAKRRVGDVVTRWVHGGVPVEHFTGRNEELDRLDRWAADPEVRLVGVTAWGGAGKTALVTEWLTRQQGAGQRPALRGLFAWSFYEDRSPQRWAEALLAWVEGIWRVPLRPGPLAARVLAVAESVPLLLVLDGLEVLQEGPAGGEFGRLLDGTLREVLAVWCQLDHAGLAVLTSRFPFADLEQFDGGAARMLDVPAFTPAEGSALLARAGAGWLPERRRRDLVHAVDGHALAVAVLARLLADRRPTTDLDALHADLVSAGRTDARVARVLEFYGRSLADPDRHLVAIVGLFQRPVTMDTIIALGSHETMGAPLAHRTPVWIEAAVRHRLTGLLTWHADRTVSAHPLVRDAFRPLALTPDTAQLASNISLADLPEGPVASVDAAARVVEMIELLLDADQWTAAADLYHGRAQAGQVWMSLPAARLGQRAANAFVATPARQAACLAHISVHYLAFYLNEAGLFGMVAADLASAEVRLRAAVAQTPADDHGHLWRRQHNVWRCRIWWGDAEEAKRIAADALERCLAHERYQGVLHSRACLAAAHDLAGETQPAETEFLHADRLEVSGDPDGDHLFSLRGTLWGEFLLRTGRGQVARALTERNRNISRLHGWHDNVARCDRLLGCCDLADGHLEQAGERLGQALTTFRNGDLICELTQTLPILAEQRRRSGALDKAERLCTEAIVTGGPRGLVPSHARALAVRARVRGDRHERDGDPASLARGRDDADHALRLATRTRRLPWVELDALDAHGHLDRITGADHGWERRAAALRATLVPDRLPPDPLTVVEQEVGRRDDQSRPPRRRKRRKWEKE